MSDSYTVLDIKDGVAICLNKNKSATEVFQIDELVSVAKFGDSIYPYLKLLDTVCNAPESDLWHTLIEADNNFQLNSRTYRITVIYVISGMGGDPDIITRSIIKTY